MAYRKIIGTLGDDNGVNALVGDNQRNILLGLTGDDDLDGGDGSDRLFGGAGNDLLIYDSHDRIINGGAGIDTLRFVWGGQAYAHGQMPRIAGIEAIEFASTDNLLTLTAKYIKRISANDTLIITGDHGNRVDPGSNWHFDGFSDDGRFYILTKAGATLRIENSVQVIGFNDSTQLFLGYGDDVWGGDPRPGVKSWYTHGGPGNDHLGDIMEMSQLFGDAGDDTLITYSSISLLHGGDGNDTITAFIDGVLYGDAGNDVLHMAGGNIKIAEGGDGADTFVIHYTANFGSNFRILDFNGADGDRIQISAPAFAWLSAQDMTLQPVTGNSDMYLLGYVDDHGNTHPMTQLVGTDLQLSTLLPSIDFMLASW